MNSISRKVGSILSVMLTVGIITSYQGVNNPMRSEIQNESSIGIGNVIERKLIVEAREKTEKEVESIFIDNEGKTIPTNEMVDIIKESIKEYVFDSTDESIYMIKDTSLKGKPYEEAEDLVAMSKYDEITLLGTNELKYWKVVYNGGVYYVDKESVTREYSDIERMKEEERREEQRANFDKADLIIIGDSRMVGLDSAVSTDAKIIAKVSMGLKWLNNTAMPEARNYIDDDSVIVFCLGINDMYNVNKYVTAYNSIKQEFPNNRVCFLSITPVDEVKEAKYGYSVTNDNVMNFNQKMKDQLVGIEYIDGYTFLMQNGFESGDGLHYSGNTYRQLYDYMVNSLY